MLMPMLELLGKKLILIRRVFEHVCCVRRTVCKRQMFVDVRVIPECVRNAD